MPMHARPGSGRAPSAALLVVTISILLTLILPAPATAMREGHDPADPYRKVRIEWSVAEVYRGAEAFAGIELMHIERGQYISVLARNAGLSALSAAGIPYSIEVEDLEALYAEQAAALGIVQDFGPYHTYSETIQFMDDLHANYPDITTDKIALGRRPHLPWGR